MKGDPEQRACELGAYILAEGATVRAAASRFGISKSTVHTVVTIRVGFIGLSRFQTCNPIQFKD